MGACKTLGIVGTLAAFVGSGGVAPQQQAPMSPFLSAKSADPLTFASVAVSNGIPTGFAGPALIRRLPARAGVRGTDSRDRNIPAIVSEFNSAHRDYRASLSSGGLMIENVRPPAQVEEAISRMTPSFQVDHMPAFAALIRVGELLAVTPDTGGGVAGNAQPGECPTHVPVSIHLTRPRVRDVLDTIAGQTTSGWALIYDLDAPTEKLKLGMLCRDGASIFFTVRGW
jgi:hypothetical protein